MTVIARPRDTDGTALQANINSLTTQIGVTSSALTLNHMNIKLDQAQRELVAHYLDTGRLTAASILSTMT